MKRIFKFKKGDKWDGDEAIFHLIEDQLLIWAPGMNTDEVKQDTKITVIIEKVTK